VKDSLQGEKEKKEKKKPKTNSICLTALHPCRSQCYIKHSVCIHTLLTSCCLPVLWK